MLSVLLFLLRIIGIVLLIIISVLILALLSILLIPVRYRANLSKNDTVYGKAVFQWLFHILHASAVWDKMDVTVSVRLLGIKIYQYPPTERMKIRKDRKENRRARKEEQKLKKSRRKKLKEKENHVSKDTNLVILPDDSNGKDSLKKNSFIPNYDKINVDKANENEEERNQDEPLPFLTKWVVFLRALYRGMITYLKKGCNIKYTFQKIYDRIKDVTEQIQYYYNLYQKKRTKAVIKMLKQEIPVLLKHVKPKKIRVQAQIGLGDPMITGEAYGFFCTIAPLLDGEFHVIPDFEKTILEGSAFLKGRIRILTVLWVAQKLYFDKNLRIVIRQLKREDLKHGRE